LLVLCIIYSLSIRLVGPIGYPELPVRNYSYHYWLRNNPEERSFHLLRGLKPEITQMSYKFATRLNDSYGYLTH